MGGNTQAFLKKGLAKNVREALRRGKAMYGREKGRRSKGRHTSRCNGQGGGDAQAGTKAACALAEGG